MPKNWEDFNNLLATDVDVTNLEKWSTETKMSNIKQIEVHNYPMFQSIYHGILKVPLHNLNKIMTLPSFLKLPPCTEKAAVLQNVPVATPRLIIARPMSCFGIRCGWSYDHLRRCPSGCSFRIASPWTSRRKPISFFLYPTSVIQFLFATCWWIVTSHFRSKLRHASSWNLYLRNSDGSPRRHHSRSPSHEV